MAIKIFSAMTIGVKPIIIEVEVDLSSGLSQFIIVGLGDASIQEAKERIRFAVKNSGYEFPRQRKIINLAPANLKKQGSNFDLAMAVGLLAASKQLPMETIFSYLFLGELNLEGEIKGINGVLPMVNFAKKNGFKAVILAEENKKEALLVDGIDIFSFRELKKLIAFLKGEEKKIPEKAAKENDKNSHGKNLLNFTDIKGQMLAKRALLIAASGRHNLLLCGPPGCGKTLLVSALPSIMPSLKFEDAVQVSSIHSVAGLLDKEEPLICYPPMQHIHHTASTISIIGGGKLPKPGAISLAHKGVLFLDELPEFPAALLESLRQPLEDGIIHVHRAQGTCVFPARFMLVGTMNPCPCGFSLSEDKNCTCTSAMLEKYRRKISGPLLDRIDLIVSVQKLSSEELLFDNREINTGNEEVFELVSSAQEIQYARQNSLNGEIKFKKLKKYVALSKDCQNFMRLAVEKFNLSGRSFDRILRVGRTIADLEKSQNIQKEHLAEACQYRPMSLFSN